MLICYLQVYHTTSLNVWRIEEKPVSFGTYSLSNVLCNFGFTLFFVVGLHMGWIGRVYAWVGLGLLYTAIAMGFLIKRNYMTLARPQMAEFKEALRYGLPLMPHDASFWLKQGLDRYIVNYFWNAAAVGYLSFALNLSAIIAVFGAAFNQANSVNIYKKLAGGYLNAKSTLLRMNRMMTLAFLGIAVCGAFIAIGIIYFFSPKYMPSLQYILPVSLAAYFQCLYLLWVNYLFYYKKTARLMTITVSTGLLQATLSLWLTRYGVIYTAYISMAIVLLTFLLVRRETLKTLRDEELKELAQEKAGQ